ncbi:MAG: hypothetical protein WD231_01245 [Candidatus Woykebacteria bacterium]
MMDVPLISFLILFVTIFLIGEISFKYLRLNSEITRRSTHLLSGLVAFMMPYHLTLGQAVALGILFTLVLAFSEVFKLLPSVTRVNRSSLGSILFPLGLVTSGLLFWDSNLTAFKLSVLVLAISDSVAGFVGYKYGKRKLFFVTSEGSLAFLLTTFSIFCFFGFNYGEISISSLVTFVVFSLVLTFAEAATTKGWDNLLLPVIAGFFASLLF